MWDPEHTRWLRLLTPGVAIVLTGWLTRRACGGLTTSATSVPLRPPGWVFGVVWPILYLTTGLAWFHTKNNDVKFLFLVGLLCLWLPVYSCAKEKVLGAVTLSLGTILAFYITLTLYRGREHLSSKLMIPLSVWLVFATYLNIGEILSKKKG